jgi:F0F1-type ATP synthase membrane subunit b/b'
VMLTGLILPKQQSEFVDDWSWRIVYSLPLLFAFVQMIIFSAKFKWEPVNYLIDKKTHNTDV